MELTVLKPFNSLNRRFRVIGEKLHAADILPRDRVQTLVESGFLGVPEVKAPEPVVRAPLPRPQPPIVTKPVDDTHQG